MTTRMIEIQKRAFLARSMDAARRLEHELVNLSDAQRSTILAIVAKNTSTPVDLTYWADADDREAIASLAAGHLRLGEDQNTYLLGSGCLFQVVPQPGTETP